MRRPLILLASALVLVAAACGASDSEGTAATTTTKAPSTTSSTTVTTTTVAPSTSTTVAPTTTSDAPATTAPAEVDPACAPYFTIVDLYASLEPIATGSADAQDAAQVKWDDATAALAKAAGTGDAKVAASIATLAKLDFHVTEDATGAPTEQELLDAFAALDGAYAKPCGSADVPTECPAPETLAAEGYTCDSEGNLTPIG